MIIIIIIIIIIVYNNISKAVQGRNFRGAPSLVPGL